MEPRFLTGDRARRDTWSMMTVTTSTGERIRLDQRAVAELGATFRGELVGPGDAGYETHRRVWNGSIDRHPALIARCAGVADVIDALRFARRSRARRRGPRRRPQLPRPVGLRRRAGHRPVADEGDPGRPGQRGRCGRRPGSCSASSTGRRRPSGWRCRPGIVTHTGLAGLTLGGGIGWLMRKYGLTIDQLLSVDLVTADGELVKASADENADLFWGVRGGRRELRHRHRVRVPAQPGRARGARRPGLLADGAVGRRCCASTATGSPTCPDELTTIVVHRKAPPLPCVPAELHGRPSSRVICCYAGPVEDGERVVRPLKSFGSPVLDLCVPKPFVAHQAMFDASFPAGLVVLLPVLRRRRADRRGHRHHRRARPADPLAADGLPDLAAGRRGRRASATTRRPSTGAAAGLHLQHQRHHRDRRTGFEEEREWSRSFWSALPPYHTSVYVNFLMDEGEERVRRGLRRQRSTSG